MRILPSGLTDSQRSILLTLFACGLVGLLATTEGAANWTAAAADVAHGDPLYQPGSGRNAHAVTYPYLPVYAWYLAVVGFLPAVGINAIASWLFGTVVPVRNVTVLLITATGYVGWVATSLSVGWLLRDSPHQFYAMVATLLFPVSLATLLFNDATAIMIGLLLAGLSWADLDRPMLAGLALGLSTFKFVTIPFAILGVVYIFSQHSFRSAGLAVAGGALSQFPNVVHFALHPSDLWRMIDAKGAMTYGARTYNSVWHWPFETAGVDVLVYSEIVWPVMAISVTLGAAYLLYRGYPLSVLLLPLALATVPLLPAESELLLLWLPLLFALAELPLPVSGRLYAASGAVTLLQLVQRKGNSNIRDVSYVADGAIETVVGLMVLVILLSVILYHYQPTVYNRIAPRSRLGLE